jgi:hypothetical protein
MVGDLTCPFCELTADRPTLHAHLTDEHVDRVETSEDGWNRRFYQLTCPRCGDFYRKEVNPRSREPHFLEEYAREIRVVAFDQFLYHLELHEEEESSSA